MHADRRRGSRRCPPASPRIALERHQRGAQRVPVDAIAGDQAFGAPATGRVDVLVHVRRRGFVGRRRRCAHAQCTRTAVEVVGDALQPVHEAARTGIDHAGTTQRGHLHRGACQRDPRTLQRRVEVAARIPHGYLRRFLERVGKCIDHAEDGAFHRLGEGGAGAAFAIAHRRGQAGRIQLGRVPRVFGQADQELRHDRAGVAAGAIDRIVAHAHQQLADVTAATAQRALQDVAQGRGEVAAGIPVGHREDVDAVEFITGVDDPAGTGNHRAAEGGRGDGRKRGVIHL